MSISKLKWLFAVLVTLAVVGVLVVTNIPRIAVLLAPDKRPVNTRTQEALLADSLFWGIFHGGQYDQLGEAQEALTRAYLKAPGDATTAAHLAWVHIWASSEASRLDTIPATITDHIRLAQRYFEESVALDPEDPRKLLFLGGTTVGMGSIDSNEARVRRGYYILKDAIKQWPEFNLFTTGYVLSQTPAHSARYDEAVDYEWDNLDVCVGEKLDRKNPDYRPYMKLETTEGPKRACWNSWIAPHNFEGFFLNHGDMLVKNGDWETAQKVYAIARLSRTYDQWPYREVLEERIRNAEVNETLFNQPRFGGRNGLMIRLAFSCMACHQE